MHYDPGAGLGSTSFFQRALLRRSVLELTAERSRCDDCGRTPLTGERLYRYERGQLACELCSPLRAADPLGSQQVRHSEHGQAVRPGNRAAA